MGQCMSTTSRVRPTLYLLIITQVLSWGAFRCGAQTPTNAQRQTWSLKECLRIAMEKNHSRPASQFAVAMAEAQHRQALAGYWPQLTVNGGVTRIDKPYNFVFPASQMYIPSQQVTIPGGTATVTIPANAFGPGFPPTNVQLPVAYPGQQITTHPQQFPIPAQDVKLMDPTISSVEGDFKWLLSDGGMRRGYSEQALGALGVAKAEARRTDLELADSVVRLYYGAVLARQLGQLGRDTQERMEATLRITESLYKEGAAGTVTKADYLDNKVMVETVRSMVAPLEKNEASAKAALAYTMGLPWNETVEPADTEVPYVAYDGKLDELVTTAYEFNPDWAKIDAGLRALEGEQTTAMSGHYPKIALTGDLHRWWNSYDGGISTTQNRAGWAVGSGIEIPVFDGFLTTAKVAEARARINKLKEEKLLLKEGIGLQVRDLFLGLQASEKVYHASLEALTAARDDRDLTSRAYETGLLATERVIRVQLQEALVTAGYFRAVYEHRALQSQIDLIVGQAIQVELSGTR
jgi:outer membrane protein